MKSLELNINDLDKRFKEILSELSVDEINEWLENDRQEQLEFLLQGNSITITSDSNNTETFVRCQFDENFNELMNEYKSCKNSGDSMKSTDYIDFNDFCIGKWQKLDY
jgi:hypothetical protein